MLRKAGVPGSNPGRLIFTPIHKLPNILKMTKKKNIKRKNINQGKKEDNKKLFAFLATFLSLVGFIIALIVKKKDAYVMYYAKQGIVIFIIGVIAGIISDILIWIPIMGGLIRFSLNILIFIAWLISWINALSGKKKEIFIISYWSKKINL